MSRQGPTTIFCSQSNIDIEPTTIALPVLRAWCLLLLPLFRLPPPPPNIEPDESQSHVWRCFVGLQSSLQSSLQTCTGWSRSPQAEGHSERSRGHIRRVQATPHHSSFRSFPWRSSVFLFHDFLFFSLMHTSVGHIDVCLQKGTDTHWRLDVLRSTGPPDLYST